jgi:pentatricopeptide repeat protein
MLVSSLLYTLTGTLNYNTTISQLCSTICVALPTVSLYREPCNTVLLITLRHTGLHNNRVAPLYYHHMHTLHSIAMTACSKCSNWERALALLVHMQHQGLQPDAVNYNSAIVACGEGGAWQRAEELVQTMITANDRRLQPTVNTYACLVVALGKAGQWQRALSVLRSMQKSSSSSSSSSGASSMPRPNAMMYNAAIRALSRADEPMLAEAAALLEEMQDADGIRPDVHSYNAAIACCGDAWQSAVVLMGKVRLSLSAHHVYYC